MFHNEILPDFFKCCLELCFTTGLLFFYYESCLSGSSFEATVGAPPSPQDRKECPFKFIGLFPYSTCVVCLDVSCLFRCSMSKCELQSALWYNEAQQDIHCQCKDHFALFFCHAHHPQQPILLTKYTFSHSSVITAYSQAMICTTCVWKHLGLFCPLF